MLSELPRRAFSMDPGVQNDFESENEENRLWKEAAMAVRELVTVMVEKRLTEKAGGVAVPDDLLEGMISSYHNEYGKDGIGAEELVAALGDNLVEILFAGYNTVVNVIANALFFLATNPEWFGRLQEEIDAVCKGQKPTETHLDQLPLCRKLFLESLRLAPPAAVIARLLTEDIELDGVVIPKGVEVCLPAFALHTNPAVWGDDAAGFNPDRFEKPPPRGAFIPFSDGARSCVGQHFAQLEAVCSFVSLLQRYTFKVPEDYKWSLIFTGFGYRPWDMTQNRVCTRLIPVKRLLH